MNLLDQNETIIDKAIVRGIKEMGFEQLTPIQEQAIPEMLKGKDIIGQAQTGTGKTAAFGIPLIQMCDPQNEKVQAIVLCPTRELAIQAADELRKFAKYVQGVKVLPIYGGQDISKQIRSLSGKVSIVVGTPGRVMDHIRRHTLKLGNLKMVVLDEADEMLNMGFREDIEKILTHIPEEHQTALFSATMPKAILDITNTYQKKDAVHIKVVPKELTIPLVKQYYYEVNSSNKIEVAARLLDYYNPKRSLIFCNTKHMVDVLCEELKGRGYFAEGLHGDLSQIQRDKVMGSFRNGTCEILIATDVAARGIDVDDVEAVINFDVPQDIEYYVHRIGRTGRAGRSGRAFTLVVGKEIYKIYDIEKACKTTMKQRHIPSAKDLTSKKADGIFEELFKVINEQDLSEAMNLVQEKMEDNECTAISIAAALLKLKMGDEPKEIVVEKFFRRKSGRNDNRRTDGRRTEGRRAEGRRTEGRRTEGRRTEGRRTEGRRTEGRRTDGRKNDVRKIDSRRNDNKRTDDKKDYWAGLKEKEKNGIDTSKRDKRGKKHGNERNSEKIKRFVRNR